MENELYDEEQVPCGCITGVHLNVSTREDTVSMWHFIVFVRSVRFIFLTFIELYHFIWDFSKIVYLVWRFVCFVRGWCGC